MIKATTPEQLSMAEKLFSGWEETLITSCLQQVMGSIYLEADAAAAYLGDFAFFAGKPEETLIRFYPDEGKRFLIMVPQNEAWAKAIEQAFPDAKKVTRYALRKDTQFDTELLRKLAVLPDGFQCRMMDEALFRWSKEQDWCRDWVSQYADFKNYQRYGLGAVVLKDGMVVSGASAYSAYCGGIEIEIQTLPAYRRMGLATCAAATLILGCLERGLYPSWDAANLWSVGLAQKLGYAFSHEYCAYFVNRF